MRTLIVEDDFTSRKLLQRILLPYGECDIAVNGLEALDAFKLAKIEKRPYDLICLDILMPNMDGHKVLRKIRETEVISDINEADRVKVVITTALADYKNVKKAMQGKCQAYLLKPIGKRRLLEKLQTLGLQDEKQINSIIGSGVISSDQSPPKSHQYFSRKRYEVMEELKTGGMGKIYKVKDMNLDRICIVKEMTQSFNSNKENEDGIRRFKSEARLLVKLSHPRIPRVTDYFVENSNYYMVMDYIEYKNLEELLHSGYPNGIPENILRKFAMELIEILIYLHSQNPPIIHRDLKPANLVLSNNAKIYLVDFGIAKIMNSEGTGTAIGTPGYAPPEQFKGKTGIRSDIYAFGATFHHLITGKDPREGKLFDFSEIRKPGISLTFRTIIDKCLKFNQSERFQNFFHLKRALLIDKSC